MALLAYFQQDDSILPNPDSPLSTAVSVSAIRVANKEVKPVLDLSSMAEGKTSKRGPYNHFIPKEKAHIAQRAAENGVTATVHYFSRVYPGHPLTNWVTVNL